LTGAGVVVRELEPSEWRAFRDVRLHALRSEPGLFFSSHDAESALGETEWRRRVRNPNGQMFGVFDGERLVGITGVITARDDPSGESAMLIASYLLPEYRGRGLSRLLYEARLAWVRERPRYRRVVVSHRRSNEPSRRAIGRFGFAPVATVSTTWPDGSTDDELQYAMAVAELGSRTEHAAGTALVDATDDDFAAMLRGDGVLPGGLRVPPGGIDEPAVLHHVRAILAGLREHGYPGGHWIVAAGGEAVGLIGFKHPPSPDGEVEIGYGIAAARRRRGHATRGVALALDAARRDPSIRAVVAETTAGNAPSQRALARNGFARAGTRFDPDDGELVVWRIVLAPS